MLAAVPKHDDPDAPGCWLALGGDGVRTAFEARLRAAYDANPALAAAAVPSADRPARVAELRATLRALELEEELVIVRAQRRGMWLSRRADIENVAVLFHPDVLEAEGFAAA